MAAKYNDIINIRHGKAAYNIAEEKAGEWLSFIPNEQFNSVLRTVLKSVRGNDIDVHKSFWINGTYGTGKSHAVSVICHLLCDEVADIRDWVDYEYKSEKFEQLKSSIYSLREGKRLLPVMIYGLNSMVHPGDLSVVLQKAIKETLKKNNIDICMQTDFETYICQIEKNVEIWNHLIQNNRGLSTTVANRGQLIENLKSYDLSTFHRVGDALRDSGLDVRMSNNNVKQWLIDVQNELKKIGTYDGLLVVWDEFTDVMSDAVGLPVLKVLQEIAEVFMNKENSSYLFLISHPSAFDKVGSEQLKQTDGRYHRMKYNMESVSAFKIMSRKFNVIDEDSHERMCKEFYQINPNLLTIFTNSSNDKLSTTEDLYKLFPLHPGTANLATHYATVVGSSSRSVFEFLGQNDAINSFLEDESHFSYGDTITADYLWDYVLKVFQDDTINYGAVTERYNSYVKFVESQGEKYLAIFKGVLLLNAFNNVSGGNNNGLVTPSEENIHYLFDGSRYADSVDEVLGWFNEQGVIQRAPGGLYSIQFSALPSGEIEEKKAEMQSVAHFKHTHKIIEFAIDVVKGFVEKKIFGKVYRPYEFRFFSDIENESLLRSQIKNVRKNTKPSSLFFALLLSRNNAELAKLRTFAERCADDKDDAELENIVFIVVDDVLGDSKYEQFVEYQANYECASVHGFVEQAKTNKGHALDMVKEWLEAVQRNNATIYINNGSTKQAISMRLLTSIINSAIIPAIFPYAPDAHDNLRTNAASTFWRVQSSKEVVRMVMFAKSREDLLKTKSQMKPIHYLFEDCLDDNLSWKENIPENHPLKMVYDKVNVIIKHADKSSLFNFAEKFSQLTKPPYGLYSNYASMGTMTFALRPWINKIFDPQGKSRDANALCDDIVLLFKAWEDNDHRTKDKLNFKFQTQEEGRLCKELISLFKLNKKDNSYSDISSLKDARYAINSDFLERRKAPLWAIKYAPDSVFVGPVKFSITNDIKCLIDDIVKICTDRELRNPALINDALTLIDKYRIEMKNILNVDAVFSEGFNSYLMQLNLVNVQKYEVDKLKQYIEQNLESSVGYWTEEEVEKKALEWRVSQSKPDTPELSDSPRNPVNYEPPIAQYDSNIAMYKRNQAKKRIENLTSLEDAKKILLQLCEQGNEWVLDTINN